MLQVWIPGIENLNNQGLSSSIITQGGTYISSGGKIGKGCINASNMTINYGPGKAANQTSVTFWHKWNGAVPTGWVTTFHFPYNSGEKRYYLATNESHFYPAFVSSGGNTKFTLDSNWHHIALVGTDSKLIVYIDGIEDCTIPGNAFTLEGNAFFTSCYLNDIRIYDHSLSPKEVHEIAKGLVLHYPMNDEYVESTVYDCSGYCNNGTITGSLQVVDDSPRYKKSIKNTSTVDNIIKAELNMPSMNQLTLNWWGKYNNGFADGASVGNSSAGGYINSSNNPNHAYDYDTTAFNYRDGIWDMYNGSSHYILQDSLRGTTDNTWRMYTLVWNGSKAIQYVNGDPTNSIIISGALVPFKYLYIGQSYAGSLNRVTTGCWSDIRLYSTALSDDDIKELYNTSAIINNNNTLQAYEFVE